MRTLALTLSIISSVVFIIYLLVAMFSSRQSQENNTITIRGSFVTRTIDTAGNSYTINHVVEHH